MTTTDNSTGQAEDRPIPPMPGGGSWRLNETTWAWESTDPVVVAAVTEVPEQIAEE